MAATLHYVLFIRNASRVIVGLCLATGALPVFASCRSADAGTCSIEAANYDQSCSVESDCIGEVSVDSGPFSVTGLPVTFGNYCAATMCFCGGGAISRKAVPQFIADVSKTPVGSGAIAPELCFCPQELPPCCANGRCTTSPCPASTAEATLDAGDR